MEFVEELYNENLIEEKREACRGIILKDHKLLMVYCEYYNDYSFPGGGREKDESKEECLIRELKEEVGAIISSFEFFEEVIEKRNSTVSKDRNFFQNNYFYICNMEKEVETNLEDYEIEFGFQKVFVDIDETIAHNEKVLEMAEKYRSKYLKEKAYKMDEETFKVLRRFGAPTALKRDLYILNLIKEKMNEGI